MSFGIHCIRNSFSVLYLCRWDVFILTGYQCLLFYEVKNCMPLFCWYQAFGLLFVHEQVIDYINSISEFHPAVVITVTCIIVYFQGLNLCELIEALITAFCK